MDARKEMLGALTERDIDIIQWLADGKRNGEIAAIFTVSTGVVEQRLHEIKNKIGASTSCSCVAIALRHGIIK